MASIHLKYFLLFAVLVNLGALEENFDYCEFDQQHILCNELGDNQVDSDLVAFKYPKTKEERDVILKALNAEREKIAVGQGRFNNVNLPPASNLMELEWCEKCERAAFNILKTCEFVIQKSCCDCFNIGDMTLNYYAQVWGDTDPENPFVIDKQIKMMLRADEDEKFRRQCVDSMTENCFTSQLNIMLLASSKVTHVGCAFTECQVAMNISTFVCFFNIEFPDAFGKPLYRAGPPCSNCPQNSRCTEYSNNLCECEDDKDCYQKSTKLGEMCQNTVAPHQYNYGEERGNVDNKAGNGTVGVPATAEDARAAENVTCNTTVMSNGQDATVNVNGNIAAVGRMMNTEDYDAAGNMAGYVTGNTTKMLNGEDDRAAENGTVSITDSGGTMYSGDDSTAGDGSGNVPSSGNTTVGEDASAPRNGTANYIAMNAVGQALFQGTNSIEQNSLGKATAPMNGTSKRTVAVNPPDNAANAQGRVLMPDEKC